MRFVDGSQYFGEEISLDDMVISEALDSFYAEFLRLRDLDSVVHRWRVN